MSYGVFNLDVSCNFEDLPKDFCMNPLLVQFQLLFFGVEYLLKVLSMIWERNNFFTADATIIHDIDRQCLHRVMVI